LIEQGLKVEGYWKFIYEDGRVIEHKNQIVQSGLDLLAAFFIGEEQNQVPFYLAMGTSTNPVSLSDTKLANESFRKIITSETRSGSTVRLRFFLQSTEANGNWNEFGVFVKGTELKDSGVLFNRLVKPISKASNMVLTVEVRITFIAT
jgi:hypothetical protein